MYSWFLVLLAVCLVIFSIAILKLTFTSEITITCSDGFTYTGKQAYIETESSGARFLSNPYMSHPIPPNVTCYKSASSK